MEIRQPPRTAQPRHPRLPRWGLKLALFTSDPWTLELSPIFVDQRYVEMDLAGMIMLADMLLVGVL